DSVVTMGLEHAVITSVNRDELKDGGASIYAETIRQIHARVPGCSVEVLIPDFKGNEEALRTVVEARPEILAHNVDTVERLMRAIRPGGRYWRSISLLGAVKRMNPEQLTKSAIILGMGETEEEIYRTMRDLREAAVDILTLGQYLRPSQHHIPLDRWVHPDEFRRWKEVGEQELGFRHVESGPLVRSSYHAKEQAREVEAGGPGAITEILEADLSGGAQIDPAEEEARRAYASLPVQPRLVQLGSL
ncbi:MAG TPA: lipoyl synthase, partial [Longimicrobiaceae bacterium]|nr:lipoyl synthase [Longimicrobiaceae bacterium]